MDAVDKPTGSPQEMLRARLATLKMIHAALVTGVIVFALVALAITRGRLTTATDFSNPMTAVAAAVSVSSVLLAAALRKVMPRLGPSPRDIEGSLNRYQGFVLVRAAMVEGGALLATVVLLVTHNAWALVPVLLSAGALAFFRPSQGEFVALACGDDRSPGEF